MATMRIAMTPVSIKCWYPGLIRRTPPSCWTICWRNMTRRWGRILEVRLEENQAAATWERPQVTCVQTPWDGRKGWGLVCDIWGYLVVRGENAMLALFTWTNQAMLVWLGLLLKKLKRKLWVVVGVLWLHLQNFYDGTIKPTRTGNGTLEANPMGLILVVWGTEKGCTKGHTRLPHHGDIENSNDTVFF